MSFVDQKLDWCHVPGSTEFLQGAFKSDASSPP